MEIVDKLLDLVKTLLDKYLFQSLVATAGMPFVRRKSIEKLCFEISAGCNRVGASLLDYNIALKRN